MTEILIIAVVFIVAILALILPQKPKTNSKPLNLEDLVQIANEFKASKIIASTQELEGIAQFSDKLIDLAIKQLNNTKVKS